MFSHERVEEMLQEEIVKAKEAGIPISKDIDPHVEFPKARSFYGYCCYRDSKHPDHEYYIRISEFYLGAPESEVRETLMHELIHTCKQCHGHGKVWKRFAAIANSKYGYRIERTGTHHNFDLDKAADEYYEETGIKVASRPRQRMTTKYIVRCEECGREWRRTRRSNLTMNPQNYGCPRCGLGTLSVLEV